MCKLNIVPMQEAPPPERAPRDQLLVTDLEFERLRQMIFRAIQDIAGQNGVPMIRMAGLLQTCATLIEADYRVELLKARRQRPEDVRPATAAEAAALAGLPKC